MSPPGASASNNARRVQQGVDLGKAWRANQPKTEAARERLFNQTGHTAGRRN